MRCQCIICQDLFENKDDKEIVALQCGHTFHTTCVNTWLTRDMTCPSCRKPVLDRNHIRRLFLSGSEEDDVMFRKLQTDINNLKKEVQKKVTEKEQLVEKKQQMEASLQRTEGERKNMEKKLREKHTESQMREDFFEAEKKAHRATLQKLTLLQDFQTLLKGCEAEATEVISRTSGGPNALQNISKQLIALKGENVKMKQQKEHLETRLNEKLVREAAQKIKMEALTRKCKQHKLVNREKAELICKHKADCEALSKDYNVVKDNLKKMEESVEDKTETADILEMECIQLKVENRKVKLDKEMVTTELETKKKEFQKLQQAATANVALYTKKENEFRVGYNKLREDLIRSKNSLATSNNEVAVLRRLNDQLKQEKKALLEEKIQIKTETNTVLKDMKKQCKKQAKRSEEVIKMIEQMEESTNRPSDIADVSRSSQPNGSSAVKRPAPSPQTAEGSNALRQKLITLTPNQPGPSKQATKRPLESSENGRPQNQAKKVRLISQLPSPSRCRSPSSPSRCRSPGSPSHCRSPSSPSRCRSPSSPMAWRC